MNLHQISRKLDFKICTICSVLRESIISWFHTFVAFHCTVIWSYCRDRLDIEVVLWNNLFSLSDVLARLIGHLNVDHNTRNQLYLVKLSETSINLVILKNWLLTSLKLMSGCVRDLVFVWGWRLIRYLGPNVIIDHFGAVKDRRD